MHQSIATINSPEFINLQPLDLNPQMSLCDIKVLYIGENRNRSFITKEVATEMAKTLRGAPIVGYFKEDKGDFADHGEVVYIDDEGIHFECKTRPYGFVSPSADVWFQKFEDLDDFGNAIEREYLMTTGYLWVGQFPEIQDAIMQGRPQSMELDEKTLNGKWSTNTKTGMDFFIINDAIFSKLCILGEDVEPCFEGASILAPTQSTSYTMDTSFTNTLFSMIQDLKNFALKGDEINMEDFEKNANTPKEADSFEKKDAVENSETSFAKKEDEKEKEETTVKEDEKEEDVEDSEEKDKETEDEKASEEEEKEEDDEDKKKKVAMASLNNNVLSSYLTVNAKDTLATVTSSNDVENKFNLLKEEYDTLNSKYEELKTEYQGLLDFKLQIENEKKDELIKSFYMLSDEDKKDVIENKSKYSYDEIEAKLSVICVRKRVNFDLEDSSENKNTLEEKETPVMTFNLEDTTSSIPAWVQALKNARSKNN